MTRQHNKPAGESRVRRNVTLSAAEDAALVARASAADVSVPRWLVESGLGDTPSQRRASNAVLSGLLVKLAGIADNVNQMATRANSVQHLPAAAAFAQLRDEVRSVCAEIRAARDAVDGP